MDAGKKFAYKIRVDAGCFVTLRWNSNKAEFFLVTREEERARDAGLTLSTVTRGPQGEAVFFTDSPYAALPFYRESDEGAKVRLEPLWSKYEKSWAKDSPNVYPVGPGAQAQGWSFMGYQNAGIDYGLEQDNTIIGDGMGLGKAQPLDAKVRVLGGWKAIGDLKVGDGVCGYDGRGGRVTAVYDRGVMDVFEVVFSDGAKTRASADHLWRVRGTHNSWRVCPTWEVAERASHLQVYIPMTEPVGGTGKYLALDPYLLGLLLGDGGLSQDTPTITSVDPEIVAYCTAWAHRHELSLSRYDISYRFSGGRTSKLNPLTARLRLLGLMGHKSVTKFIPEQYKAASAEPRLMLLRGLMDSDGWISKGVTGYCSASERLVLDVQELVQSLGGCARIAKKKNAWTLTINMAVNPFKLSRKSKKWTPFEKYKPARLVRSVTWVGREPVRCIAVTCKDNLYLTDDFIVTHNTAEAIGLNNVRNAEHNLVLCPANVRRNWRREILNWSTLPNPLIYPIMKGKDGVNPYANYTIVSYELLQNEGIHQALYQQKFDNFIIDEGHYLKTPDARRTQAVFGGGRGIYAKQAIAERSATITELTGTLLPNRPRECFTAVKNLAWQALDYSTAEEFYYRYNPRGQMENGHWIEAKGRLPELQARLRCNLMVRRLKEDVLKDLPDKRYELTYIEPNGAITDVLRHEKLLHFTPEDLKNPFAEIWGQISTLRLMMGLAALPRMVEHIRYLLDIVEVPKLVVFSWHREVMDRLKLALNDSYGVVEVRGGMTANAKDEAIEAFKSNPDKRIFHGQLIAAGIGIDGLQNVCSHCVITEPDWVPGNNEQAADRIHRIGQHDNVLIQLMCVEDSLLERILAANFTKVRGIHASLDFRT